MEIIKTKIAATVTNMKIIHSFLRGKIPCTDFELLKDKDNNIVISIENGSAAMMVKLGEEELSRVIYECDEEYNFKEHVNPVPYTTPPSSPSTSPQPYISPTTGPWTIWANEWDQGIELYYNTLSTSENNDDIPF